MACHPFGCRVVQRVLEHCTPEQTQPLLDELLGDTEPLLQVLSPLLLEWLYWYLAGPVR